MIYSLTERSIALVPVLVQLGVWGHRELGADDRLSSYAETLDQGGRPLQETFMDDLRKAHLGPRPRHRARDERPTLQLTD